MGQDRPPDLEKFHSKNEIIDFDNTNTTQKESVKMTNYNSRKLQNTNAIYVATSWDESAKTQKIYSQSFVGFQAYAHGVDDRSHQDLQAGQKTISDFPHCLPENRDKFSPDSGEFRNPLPTGVCSSPQGQPTYQVSEKNDEEIAGYGQLKVHGNAHCRTTSRPASGDFHTGAPHGDCSPPHDRPTHKFSEQMDGEITGNNFLNVQGKAANLFKNLPENGGQFWPDSSDNFRISTTGGKDANFFDNLPENRGQFWPNSDDNCRISTNRVCSPHQGQPIHKISEQMDEEIAGNNFLKVQGKAASFFGNLPENRGQFWPASGDACRISTTGVCSPPHGQPTHEVLEQMDEEIAGNNFLKVQGKAASNFGNLPANCDQFQPASGDACRISTTGVCSPPQGQPTHEKSEQMDKEIAGNKFLKVQDKAASNFENLPANCDQFRPASGDACRISATGVCSPSQGQPTHENSEQMDREIAGNNFLKVQGKAASNFGNLPANCD
ncbi:hypothetical protein HAX54_000966 [Datura stramonium]|uniref:Uncharacterized protein n=1 Tax=Datura stramonium TaxID=4076 RepID=A0ABS8WUE4_DATST|nr:hypothetical protein [Datura stramonium]